MGDMIIEAAAQKAADVTARSKGVFLGALQAAPQFSERIVASESPAEVRLAVDELLAFLATQKAEVAAEGGE